MLVYNTKTVNGTKLILNGRIRKTRVIECLQVSFTLQLIADYNELNFQNLLTAVNKSRN